MSAKKIVALLTIRNEALYLKKCLEHLIHEGIFVYLIDNESTDNSREIGEAYRDRGVIGVETLKYPGYFDLTAILKNEERLAREIKADWFIHHDADEIRQAAAPYPTLLGGIEAADQAGYNAVNFDEFVFLPTSTQESFEGTDYSEAMKYYYFFAPKPLRRVNAWKNTGQSIDLHSSAGHEIQFKERRIFPANFILRHYMVLSAAHAIQKYHGKIYSPREVDVLAWHGSRPFFEPEKLHFTAAEKLKKLRVDGEWDRSEPRLTHEFFGELSPCH